MRVPPKSSLQSRRLEPSDTPEDGTASDLEFKLRKLIVNPPISVDVANTHPWRAAEIPAANGHGNARSVARIMSALACGGEVDGVRLLRESTIANAIEEQTYDHDLILGNRLDGDLATCW